MTAVKAIETWYASHHFRSRREARHAVLLDNLGITWEYEPEGFHLPSGRYLPDFLLHLPQPVWLEVKPPRIATATDARWAQLVAATGYHLLVSYELARDADELSLGVDMDVYCPGGQNPVAALAEALNVAVYLDWSETSPGTTAATIADDFDQPYSNPSPGFNYCDNCRTLALDCPCHRPTRCPKTGSHCGDYLHPRIVDAHHAARAARFEGGARS